MAGLDSTSFLIFTSTSSVEREKEHGELASEVEVELEGEEARLGGEIVEGLLHGAVWLFLLFSKAVVVVGRTHESVNGNGFCSNLKLSSKMGDETSEIGEGRAKSSGLEDEEKTGVDDSKSSKLGLGRSEKLKVEDRGLYWLSQR